MLSSNHLASKLMDIVTLTDNQVNFYISFAYVNIPKTDTN